jgi:hypothetical protein
MALYCRARWGDFRECKSHKKLHMVAVDANNRITIIANRIEANAKFGKM